jgi:hypothetical protein
LRTFCTYFDSRYLTRGLALRVSLLEHAGDFELYVLCLDEATYRTLIGLALPEIIPIHIETLEQSDPELLAAKANRSLIEYYFTTSPVFPLFILRRNPQIEFITYLDADLYFFGPIEPLFAELGEGSAGIIRHRFPPSLAHLEEWGIFNVGCVIFRNDARGIAILSSWREQCLEWCYDRLESTRFADQKYLDAWPDRFAGVVVLEHRGANVAPWNVGGSDVTVRDGIVFIDDQSLLFYHFHRLRHWGGDWWQLGLAAYGVRAKQVVRDSIYRPYILALQQASALLRERGLDFPVSSVRRATRVRVTDWLRLPVYVLNRELIRSAAETTPHTHGL